MRIAYLVNQYPKISHTFIRREITALERHSVEVVRFSLRRASPDQLVDVADAREAEVTTALLQRGPARLVLAALREAARAPARFFSATKLAFRTGRRSERGFLINFVYLAEACALAGELRARAVEHVHAHFGTNAAAVAMLCRALGGPRYSFTVHGPEEFDKPDLLHLREKIERSDGVFAVSHFGRSQLYRHCRRDHWKKVHVVRCGVDDSFLAAEAAPVPEAPRLVSVGRLSEQKGQLLLIDALAQLRRRGRKFHLTLVGDGEMRADVEAAIAQNDLADSVELVGWADGAAIRRHVLAARALVLPSFAEGLPVVIMEALALGRPVVSTYIAGIPELVEPGRSGWLVPAGAVDALVEAMEAVLAASPEQLAKMGAYGRARVLENHDASKIGATIAQLLRGLEANS